MRPLRWFFPLAIGIAAGPARPDPFAPGAYPRPSVEEFAQRRQLEADLELRALGRDAHRRVEEAWLRREGSRADLERYRQRTRAEDDLDRLVARDRVDALARDSGFERFQPETRRLLERSGIELRWIERRQDELLHQLERGRVDLRWSERREELERRLQELEREVPDREPPPLQPPVTTR
jgi:hypothetical protein